MPLLFDLNSVTLLRALSGVLVLLLMALLELRYPQAPAPSARTRWVNLGFAGLNTGLLRALAWLLGIGLPLIATTFTFGLLHHLRAPVWLEVLIAIVALDFAVWGQHQLMHRVPVLWRLHRVHHSAHSFDVTLGLRFHPIEALVSLAWKILAVVLLGAPLLAVLIFEILLNAGSLFEHSNLRMPKRLDTWLRLALVTPAMHRIHHSIEPAAQQSNYGFLLSWWDRAFGLYRAQTPIAEMGVEGFPEAPPRLGALLAQPFT